MIYLGFWGFFAGGGGHLSCLAFSEILGFIVCFLSLILENPHPLCLEIFLFLGLNYTYYNIDVDL